MSPHLYPAHWCDSHRQNLEGELFLFNVRTATDFDHRFRTDDNSEQFESLIETFVQALTQDATSQNDLLALLNTFVLYGAEVDDVVTDDAGKVSIMSIHKAKGLEFHTVIVLGLEDGTLPSERSFDDQEQLWEEGRICYVALTRARRHLILSRVESRSGSEKRDQSRFLRALQPTIEAQHLLTDVVDGNYEDAGLSEETIQDDETRYSALRYRIQVDTTEIGMGVPEWVRLSAVLSTLPGAFPVDILFTDEDGLVVSEEWGTIRGDDHSLRLIHQSVGAPVRQLGNVTNIPG